MRQHLFSSPLNMFLTFLLVWLLLLAIPAVYEWAIAKATWQAANNAACKQGGACWAFISHQYRLILFGLYPYAEQWRPLIASVILLALIGLSAWQKVWSSLRHLLILWTVGLLIVGVLMWGGVLGLSYVPNDLWGGLPLTLILSTFGIIFAFPLGIVLALGRRSEMPIIKVLSVSYIELIRGVPLISMLFMASVMLPLFLPEGVSIDKLLRALIAIVMFAAAYVAEVVRGGLQSIPKGQYEGAESLGLSYWQKMRLVIMPQALAVVIPPLVSIFISIFKDTSLVVIIGVYDLTQATRAALSDPNWQGSSIEAYIFISIIYFAFCYVMSKYSQSLENRLDRGHKAQK
nr:amino acid ABC transporter permease [Basilea psittacipulmonis]